MMIINNFKKAQEKFDRYGRLENITDIKDPIPGVNALMMYQYQDSPKLFISMSGAAVTYTFHNRELHEITVTKGNGAVIANYTADRQGKISSNASKRMTSDLLELSEKILKASLDYVREAQEDAELQIRKAFRKVRR